MALRPGSLAALLAVAAALHAADARAGIRPYIWTWDTQTVPQGDIELEQWLWVRGKIAPPAEPIVPSAYWIWWGPVVGVSQQLEVAFPFQTVKNAAGFNLESFEVDARYRFFSRNDDGKFQPLVRVAFHQDIWSAPDTYSRLDANAVLSYGALSEFHATVDLGVRVLLPFLANDTDAVRAQLTYAAGASYPFTTWFRAGVEVFGELDPAADPPGDYAHHFVGINASWQFGRAWLTAGTLIGLTRTTPQLMPRLIWAVAL